MKKKNSIRYYIKLASCFPASHTRTVNLCVEEMYKYALLYMQIRRTDTYIKFLYVYWCVKKINHMNMMNLDVLHKVWFDS